MVPLLATVALLIPATDLHALEGGATASGRAEVIDGDTLDIGNTRIRLFGIDAPEHAQTCATARGGEWACGWAARKALEDLTAGHTVTCRSQGPRRLRPSMRCSFRV